MSDFIKYQQQGSYHWTQTNPDPKNMRFNSPLVARYQVMLQVIPANARSGLDIGCGDGYLLHLLLQKTNMTCVVGVDSTALGVKLAQTQLRKQQYSGTWQLVVDSAYSLSFPAGKFDCILMADVIEHLAAPEQAVEQAARLLGHNGTFILSTPNWQPDKTWDQLHVQEFKPAQLESLLSSSFSNIKLFGCWPMFYMKLWKRGSWWRKTLQKTSRAIYNPFQRLTSPPTQAHGQLIAVCRK